VSSYIFVSLGSSSGWGHVPIHPFNTLKVDQQKRPKKKKRRRRSGQQGNIIDLCWVGWDGVLLVRRRAFLLSSNKRKRNGSRTTQWKCQKSIELVSIEIINILWILPDWFKENNNVMYQSSCSKLKAHVHRQLIFEIIFCRFQLVSSRWFLDYSVWDFRRFYKQRQSNPVRSTETSSSSKLTRHTLYVHTHIHTHSKRERERHNHARTNATGTRSNTHRHADRESWRELALA
jgi:hypothetical protein